MTQKNPVDTYIDWLKRWQRETAALRAIVLDTGLTETLKWWHPCYTSAGTNVVLIHGFKEYIALLFFQWAILPDPDGILIQQTEHVQAARQIRFATLEDIIAMQPTIKKYLDAAIAIALSGEKVIRNKPQELSIPQEFQERLDHDETLKTAFASLTPWRQRAYCFYFSTAKQSATREARIDRSLDRILDKKWLDDCICGHSGKMPACDGSHKQYGCKK